VLVFIIPHTLKSGQE